MWVLRANLPNRNEVGDAKVLGNRPNPLSKIVHGWVHCLLAAELVLTILTNMGHMFVLFRIM